MRFFCHPIPFNERGSIRHSIASNFFTSPYDDEAGGEAGGDGGDDGVFDEDAHGSRYGQPNPYMKSPPPTQEEMTLANATTATTQTVLDLTSPIPIFSSWFDFSGASASSSVSPAPSSNGTADQKDGPSYEDTQRPQRPQRSQ